MRNFDASGGYTHCGIAGTFTGTMRFLDDGRVVGGLIDEGKDIVFKNQVKLVFGLHDGNNLNFWKVHPRRGFASLVYAMIKDGPRYSGKWVPMPGASIDYLAMGVDGEKGLSELRAATDLSEMEERLEILEKIEKSRIEPYLRPELVRDILGLGEDTGYLNLTPV
ncbi:MAG: hypothetical protein WCK90_04680 [archaeon]